MGISEGGVRSGHLHEQGLDFIRKVPNRIT